MTILMYKHGVTQASGCIRFSPTSPSPDGRGPSLGHIFYTFLHWGYTDLAASFSAASTHSLLRTSSILQSTFLYHLSTAKRPLRTVYIILLSVRMAQKATIIGLVDYFCCTSASDDDYIDEKRALLPDSRDNTFSVSIITSNSAPNSKDPSKAITTSPPDSKRDQTAERIF